jgi:RecA/RadA recombinase
MSEQLVKRYYRTTGVPALDHLIYGWPRRGLALIYGSQKAGKTTLALQAAVTTALEEGKVLMLDTESGGIGELRLHSLAQAMGVKEDLIPRILSNITVYQAGELSEQHRIILDEWDSVRRGSDVSLYVVDSIAWLYHQRVMNAPPEHVGSVARELMGKLELQTKTLINYARDSGASIIFTSWSTSKAKKSFEEHQRREMEKDAKKGVVDVRDLDVVLGTYGEDYIGGRFIGYMAKVISRIWRLQGNLRFLVVEAHRERPDNIGLYMQITEKGLQPVPEAKPTPVEKEMLRKLLQEEDAVVSQDTSRSGKDRQTTTRRNTGRKDKHNIRPT